MIYLQFFIGFLLYSTSSFISVSKLVQSSRLFLPIGLTLALINNFIWLNIARAETNPSQVLIKALYWDCVVIAAGLMIPLCFFGASLTGKQAAGVLLIIAGLILTKI